MTEHLEPPQSDAAQPGSPVSARRRAFPARFALAGAALLAVGGGVGAIAVHSTRATIEMAPTNPQPIGSLVEDSLVTVRGRIVEVFGNKAIVDDGSGRALIDLGRAGEGGDLLAASQTVTIQGRFDRGVVRASFLIGADGVTRALGRAGPGPHDKDRRSPPPPRPATEDQAVPTDPSAAAAAPEASVSSTVAPPPSVNAAAPQGM